MENSVLTLSVDLHHFMDDENLHEMDAAVHNKCEANLIQFLNHLGDVFDENVQIDVSALGEGGIIDRIKIKFQSPTANKMALVLYGALISHFIGVAPSLDETQKQYNRAEVIKCMKEGDFSDDDVKFVFQGDPEMLAPKNRYFEELSKERNVTKVACSSYSGDNDTYQISAIERKDFQNQIVSGSTKSCITEYKGTSVLVISPVLLQGSKAKWKGIFNGKEIAFKIVDREFLKQVYAKEVGFTTGTSLNCDLKVTTTTSYDMTGKISKTISENEISEILSWDDGKYVLHETKRYKRRKIQSTQPSLFTKDELDNLE